MLRPISNRENGSVVVWFGVICGGVFFVGLCIWWVYASCWIKISIYVWVIIRGNCITSECGCGYRQCICTCLSRCASLVYSVLIWPESTIIYACCDWTTSCIFCMFLNVACFNPSFASLSCTTIVTQNIIHKYM